MGQADRELSGTGAVGGIQRKSAMAGTHQANETDGAHPASGLIVPRDNNLYDRVRGPLVLSLSLREHDQVSGVVGGYGATGVVLVSKKGFPGMVTEPRAPEPASLTTIRISEA